MRFARRRKISLDTNMQLAVTTLEPTPAMCRELGRFRDFGHSKNFPEKSSGLSFARIWRG